MPLLVAASLAIPVAGGAHHRQTDEVVPLTTTGDTTLPRLAAQGQKTLALVLDAGGGTRQVVTISPFRDPTQQTPQGGPGDVANPAISFSGKRVVWDAGGPTGRQLVLAERGAATELTQDPSGMAANPAVDTAGRYIAFESSGDLAGTGNAGIRQVFVRRLDGTYVQASLGFGISGNATVSAKKRRLAFESTSDPGDGSDTGISQIWLGDVVTGGAVPVTAGAGPSRNPALSDDGGLLAFESTADLAGGGADTGVSQIFVFDPKSRTFARLTDDASGCTLPGASRVRRDWRITFVCDGQPFYHMLRADQRYAVQTGGGTTQRVLGEMGIHFLVLSTTGDLLGGGLTAGNRVYLINLWKRPAQPVAGLATWFPVQGIPPL